MLTYGKVQALQQFRYGKHIEEAVQRRRRGNRHTGLRELLGAPAGRLATLGIRVRSGRSHPAGPAY